MGLGCGADIWGRDMKERMNVYLTSGKRNFFYCYPAIKSLFIENQDSEIYLYLVSEDLEEKDIAQEQAIARECGHHIIILHFDVEQAKKSIVCKNPEHWPLGTLGCYWMFHELLPEDVDRILAIEADTVTVGSLSQYYHTDLNGYYAASPDPEHKPANHRKLMEKLKGDTLTFVMSLYNVKAIREDFSVADILETDARVVEQFGHSQQELTFGILFRGKIKFLPGKMTCVEENRQAMGELGYDYIRECEGSCKILHFSSFVEKEKPWNPVCVMPGYMLWWKYAIESPYYKQYIIEQWKIYDRKIAEIAAIKKNITMKNLLAASLAIAFLGVCLAGILFCGLPFSSVWVWGACFGGAGVCSVILRKIMMWLQKVK